MQDKENVLTMPRQPPLSCNPHARSSYYRLNVNFRQTTKCVPRRRSQPELNTQKENCHYQSTLRRRTIGNLDFDSWDSDDDSYLLEDSQPATPTRRYTGDETGLEEYLSFCKTLNLVPVSTFRRQLPCDTVSLKYQSLTGQTFKAIAVALLINRCVTCVDIEGSDIGPEGAILMSDVLQANIFIKKLNLSGNKILSCGLKVIVEALKINSTLEKLDLSDNGLTERDASYVNDLLQSNSTIVELCLNRNSFEDVGCKTIAEGLAKNTSVEVLDLSWNHIRGGGAHAIGSSLKFNTTLEVLNVSWNGFDVSGCHGLGHGLEQNTTLRELDISSNRIGPTGVAKLLEGLKRNQTLSKLKIRDNQFGSDGALLLLGVVKRLSNITELDIGAQPVDQKFTETLTEIQKERSIRVLHGKMLTKVRQEVGDDTMYITGDPLLILLEFTRMKKVDILDLFLSLDADGSHAINWDEFRRGVKQSHIPLRPKDFEHIIRKMDINQDGQINFSELVIAQKDHNMRAEKLLAKGLDVFEESNIGAIHRRLHKWFTDKDICLKKYKLVD